MHGNEQQPVPAGPADGAVLAGAEAYVADGAAPLLEQAFDSGTLYALRAAAQAHASEAGLAEDRTDDLVISVHELAANAVRHGAGGGRLRMWERDGALHCQVEDGGPPSTAREAAGDDEEEAGPGAGPENAKAADEAAGPAGNVAVRWPFLPGHGLWLVRLVSDQLSVSSGPDGTRATALFSLSPKDSSVSSPD